MSALPSLNHLVNKQGESISHWFGHWFTHGRPFDSDCELYLLICLLIHPWFTLWEDRAFQWLIDLPCDQPCSSTGAITNSLIHLLIHPVATLCGSWVDQWHAAALIDSPMGCPLIRLLQELGCAISKSRTHGRLIDSPSEVCSCTPYWFTLLLHYADHGLINDMLLRSLIRPWGTRWSAYYKN